MQSNTPGSMCNMLPGVAGGRPCSARLQADELLVNSCNQPSGERLAPMPLPGRSFFFMHSPAQQGILQPSAGLQQPLAEASELGPVGHQAICAHAAQDLGRGSHQDAAPGLHVDHVGAGIHHSQGPAQVSVSGVRVQALGSRVWGVWESRKRVWCELCCRAGVGGAACAYAGFSGL